MNTEHKIMREIELNKEAFSLTMLMLIKTTDPKTTDSERIEMQDEMRLMNSRLS